MGVYAAAANGERRNIFMRLGVLLLIAGFFCHYFAAKAIGGTYLAYRDHLAGFFILTLVSGAIVALVGRMFWRGRPDITVLIVGIIQTAVGIFVYINRFSVHG